MDPGLRRDGDNLFSYRQVDWDLLESWHIFMADYLNQHVQRIKSIDGLRGLAISLVVFSHTYARWPEIIPWVTPYRDSFFPNNGYFGVYLFFMISGFIIFRTLETCKSYQEFLLRRWLRLFPAMFAASLLIYVTAPYMPERPAGVPRLQDTLPGLLFLEPYIFQHLTGIQANAIEGLFWSLFAEVKFYLIFGAL